MTTENNMCACGQPLHYADKKRRMMVEMYNKNFGEYMAKKVGNKTYLVQRHFLALHCPKDIDLVELAPKLGFKEVSEKI